MGPSVAIDLITKAIGQSTPAIWADFGAGNGVFTKALATLLGNESTIYAIDQNEVALDKIEMNTSQAAVIKLKKNFVTDELKLPKLDGILMANSLHYVKAKDVFVEKLKTLLKPKRRLLIVEYDTLISNQWVPYPIDFATLTTLMVAAGFSSVKKLEEQPSQFRRGNIYSALVL